MKYEKIIVYAKDLNSSLSLYGQPNLITDLIDVEGKVKQLRIYGSDGMAVKDIDTSDHKRPKFHPMGAHKHVYDYSKKILMESQKLLMMMNYYKIKILFYQE